MSRPKASFQPNSQKPKYDQLHPVNLSGLKGNSYPKVHASTQWQIPHRLLAQPCRASMCISPVMGRSLPSRANHSNTTWLYRFFQEMLLQLADCCYQTPSLPEVKQPNSSSKFISPKVVSRLFFLQVNLPSKVQSPRGTQLPTCGLTPSLCTLYSGTVTSLISNKMFPLMQPKTSAPDS